MKILFTSVGRRVELMQAFRSAAEKTKTELKIFGADMSDTAPAVLYCNEYVNVPRISSPDYIPALLKVCEEEHIDALVPTIDTDLLILSENKPLFEKIGTRVYVSDIEKVKVCRDKRFTADYFEGIGLKSPRPADKVENYSGDFPAFIKPKDGSSSINAYRVDDMATLENMASRVPDYIIQPYIEGVEYTVDIFCNYDGSPVFITPRIRLAVRSGEVLKTEIAQDDTIISEMMKFVEDYKPCGQVTVQLIRDKKTGLDYYIEINPRFGGGAPESIKAGADSAEALIRDIMGEKMKYMPKAAEDGAVYSRFDQSIRIKNI